MWGRRPVSLARDFWRQHALHYFNFVFLLLRFKVSPTTFKAFLHSISYVIFHTTEQSQLCFKPNIKGANNLITSYIPDCCHEADLIFWMDPLFYVSSLLDFCLILWSWLRWMMRSTENVYSLFYQFSICVIITKDPVLNITYSSKTSECQGSPISSL